MNIKILLLALSAAALGSCSTAYKSGQTPDDVYYSPIRVVEENQDQNKDDDRVNRDPEEREIRMASRDRRWRDLDRDYDYDRNYTPYSYGYTYGYYYNPYYSHCPVYVKGVPILDPKNTTPRMTSLGSYNNTVLVPSGNPKTGTVSYGPVRAYNNSNRNTSITRKILTTASDGSSNSRTYTPSNNSNSSSSTKSSSSSSGSFSRPAKRGN